MEFVVDATPERCIQALWDYLRQEWPYRGTVYKRENGVSFVEPTPGMLTILFKDVKSVNISVEEESPGHSRLYVLAERRKHANVIEQWIREELPQRAAAVEPRARSETPATSPDIPDQIKKLAELRDSGAITEKSTNARRPSCWTGCSSDERGVQERFAGGRDRGARPETAVGRASSPP